MGVGPVCWTSLPTGFSEWELERSPIGRGMLEGEGDGAGRRGRKERKKLGQL